MSIDAEGEVLARGSVIMSGYWEQPEETSKAIVDGWFHTGDGGSEGENHYITIADRKKDVIISGGENVSSIEVEDAIFSHPDVSEVAVIGVPDEKWGEAVKAVCVPKPGAQVDSESVIAWARARIAGFKVPRSVDIIAALPRNASGKILKRELRDTFPSE